MEDEVAQAWSRAWRRPDRRALHELARESIDLQGDYRLTGPFRVDSSRYLILPLESVTDDRIRMINLLKPVQSGGSLVSDLAFHHWLMNEPGPAMCTYQTDDDAEQHYLTRIAPTARASRHALLFERLKKKRDLYQWPGMNAYWQGANWNSLQRKSVKYEINDECWLWDLGMLEEAWRRTEAFRDVCKILNVSQAGLMYSEWYHAWEDGKRFGWAVRCQHCRGLQEQAFFDRMADDPERRAGVVWDEKHSSGRLNIDETAETARYRCRKCGHEHADDPRTWERFNAGGEYLCSDTERPIRNVSIKWTALVRGDFRGLVREYLRAMEVKNQGSVEPLKKFMMKRIMEWWDESMAEEKIVLRKGGYMSREPWDREALRFLTADFQEGRAGDTEHLRYVCRAWAEDGASRLICEGRVESFDELEALAGELEIANMRHVAIDGGHELMRVSRECAKRGWTVLVGDDKESFPHYPRKRGRKTKPLIKAYSPRKRVDPGRGTRAAGRLIAYVFYWSNPSVKDVLWRLRHGRGVLWQVPEDVSKRYQAEIDAEVKRRVLDKKTGQWRFWWVNVGKDQANHAWDCECEQVVCAMIAGILTFDIQVMDTSGGEGDDAEKKGKNKKPKAPHDGSRQLELLPV